MWRPCFELTFGKQAFLIYFQLYFYILILGGNSRGKRMPIHATHCDNRGFLLFFFFCEMEYNMGSIIIIIKPKGPFKNTNFDANGLLHSYALKYLILL